MIKTEKIDKDKYITDYILNHKFRCVAIFDDPKNIKFIKTDDFEKILKEYTYIIFMEIYQNPKYNIAFVNKCISYQLAKELRTTNPYYLLLSNQNIKPEQVFGDFNLRTKPENTLKELEHVGKVPLHRNNADIKRLIKDINIQMEIYYERILREN